MDFIPGIYVRERRLFLPTTGQLRQQIKGRKTTFASEQSFALARLQPEFSLPGDPKEITKPHTRQTEGTSRTALRKYSVHVPALCHSGTKCRD